MKNFLFIRRIVISGLKKINLFAFFLVKVSYVFWRGRGNFFSEQDPPRNTNADFLTFVFTVIGLLIGDSVSPYPRQFQYISLSGTGQICIGIILASNRMLGAALKSIWKVRSIFQRIASLLATIFIT